MQASWQGGAQALHAEGLRAMDLAPVYQAEKLAEEDVA